MTDKPHRFDLSHSWAVVGIYLLLAVCLVVLAATNPSFFSLTTFIDTIGVALPLVFAAMAQTMAVLVKGVNLAVGPTISLVTVVVATTMRNSLLSILGGSAGAVLVAMLVGAATGAFVVFGRLQAIIVTLAMSTIVSGAALYILPEPGGQVPEAFATLVSGSVGVIPVSLLFLAAVLLLCWVPLRHSRLGQGIYAAGGSEAAAHYSGVLVNRSVLAAYVLSGFFAGLAGLAQAAQALSGDPTIGGPYTLNSLAAVVLGGTSLAGGRGGMSGSIAGAFVLSILVSILFFFGVSAYYQYVFSGLVIMVALAAVTVSRWVTAARAKRAGRDEG